jgi:NAD(P)-dependent dehydrogenase (short-subunit alcohol dehydrogenase family)
VAKAIGKEFGALDILVPNAGIGEMRPLEKWDEAAFDRSFNINFKGPFFLIQALLPLLGNPASIAARESRRYHCESGCDIFRFPIGNFGCS